MQFFHEPLFMNVDSCTRGFSSNSISGLRVVRHVLSSSSSTKERRLVRGFLDKT